MDMDENQKQVIDAYLWIRKNNMSIPDHILNTMKESALAAFDTTPPKNTAAKLTKTDWYSVPIVRREAILRIRDISDEDFEELYKHLD